MTDKPAGSTNQEKTEQHKEERFRTLCNDLPAMVCEFLPDSTLTFVNKTCCDYFNMSEEELLGKRFLDFLPEEKREAAKSHYLSLDSEQFVKTNIQKVPIHDSFLWLEVRNRAIFNEHGQIVMYQAVGTDITERKKAEDALRESERRNRLILNALPDIMFIYSREGVYLDYHTSDKNLLLVEPEQFLGKSVCDVLPIDLAEQFLREHYPFVNKGDIFMVVN